MSEKNNSGNCNSGNCNSGNCNSGNSNSGNRNSGDCNSGNSNSGDRNSGDWNSGNWNSGNCNSGDRNSGDWNSGNWNSGDRNSGFFNSNEPLTRIFNNDTKLKREEIKLPKWIYNLIITKWVSESEMSEEEKKKNPKFFVTCGYLKTFGYKEAWKNLWNKISSEQKEEIRTIPNFDEVVFFDITGIDVKCDIENKKSELLKKANELLQKAEELKESAKNL